MVLGWVRVEFVLLLVELVLELVHELELELAHEEVALLLELILQQFVRFLVFVQFLDDVLHKPLDVVVVVPLLVVDVEFPHVVLFRHFDRYVLVDVLPHELVPVRLVVRHVFPLEW